MSTLDNWQLATLIANAIDNSDFESASRWTNELVDRGIFPVSKNASDIADAVMMTDQPDILARALEICDLDVGARQYLLDCLHRLRENGETHFSSMEDHWRPKAKAPIVVACCSPGPFEHVRAFVDQVIAHDHSVVLVDASLDGDLGLSPIVQSCLQGADLHSLALDKTIETFKPLGIVMQMPYLEMYNASWQEIEYRHRAAYLGYGINLIKVPHQYSSGPLRRFKYLGAHGPGEVEAYIEGGCLHRSVRWVGNPLLWQLMTLDSGKKRNAIGKNSFSADAKITILWAPHWAKDWYGGLGTTTFPETLFDICGIAQDNPSVQFVLRPHPFLLKKFGIVASRADQDALTLKWLELSVLPNVTISNSTMGDDIMNADICITDGVSIIAYASALGIPVVITRRKGSPEFYVWGEEIAREQRIVFDQESLKLVVSELLSKSLELPTSGKAVHEWFPLTAISPGRAIVEWFQESATF